TPEELESQQVMGIEPAQTDPDGEVTLDVPPGQERTLQVWCSIEGAQSAEHVVAAMDPGESRDLEVVLRTRDDAVLRGRVVDAETGEPLSGAAIATAAATFSSRPTRLARPSDPDAITGEDGSFEIPAATWREAVAVVAMDGYAFHEFVIGGSADASGLTKPVDVRVQRAVPLVLELAHAPEDVVVTGELYSTALRKSRGVTRAVRSLKVMARRDAESHVFEGLPPAISLDVIFRSGRRTIHEQRFSIADGVESSAPIVVDLARDGHIEGLVVDADGQPLEGRNVWLGRAASVVTAAFDRYDDPVARATSDAEGRFAFDELVTGQYLVAYEPARSLESVVDAAIARGSVVDVSGGDSPQTVRLVEVAGRVISGRLLGPDGEPGSGFVIASSGDGWNANVNVMPGDGRFTLGPLLPGTYSVSALAFGDGVASSLTVEAEAGAQDVEVRLRAGGTLRGRLLDDVNGEPVVDARLVYVDSGSESQSIANFQPDGTFEFRSVPAGEHHVIARTEDGRVSPFVPVTVREGEALEGVEVRLLQGGLLRLTVVGVSGYASYGVRAGDRTLYGDGIAAGAKTDISLPSGAATIEVRKGERIVSFGVEVEPGDVIERTVDMTSESGGD
ncbi:MAG: carboxypeptidase regulatory-like domain-containing protein, partial [Planctomycetota bacterium]